MMYSLMHIARLLYSEHDYEKLFLVRDNGKLVGGILGVIFNNNVIQHGVGISPSTKLWLGHLLLGTH